MADLLKDDEANEPERGSAWPMILGALAVVVLIALGILGFAVLLRLDAIEAQVATLASQAEDATQLAQQATQRAQEAEATAQAAAEGRLLAEQETQTARQLADAAIVDAESARGEAADALTEAEAARQAQARAEAEAARIRAEAEKEMNRLEEALGQIAETRRTALGVVMNLGSDYLKFEFDKAELRPEDKELLSRIAGILLTSHDYSISVNGHTDDVGSAEYNQKLSERRAQAVHDYLVSAGLSADILSVVGHGKSRPLVQGTSDEARAKNRRVELGIVNMRIEYQGS